MGCGAAEGDSAGPPPALTVDVLPVADVLQVAARVLTAQVRVGPIGLQPGVGIPPELGAGRHAARGSVPHLRLPPDSCCFRLLPGPPCGARGRGGRPARRRRGRGRKPRPAAGLAAAAAAGPRHGRRRRAGGGGGDKRAAAPALLGLRARPPEPGRPVRGGGALRSARDCGRRAELTPPRPWRAAPRRPPPPPALRCRRPVSQRQRRLRQAVPVQARDTRVRARQPGGRGRGPPLARLGTVRCG